MIETNGSTNSLTPFFLGIFSRNINNLIRTEERQISLSKLGDLINDGIAKLEGTWTDSWNLSLETFRKMVITGANSVLTVYGWHDELGNPHLINGEQFKIIYDCLKDPENNIPRHDCMKYKLMTVRMVMISYTQDGLMGKYETTDEQGKALAKHLGWLQED